MAKTETIGIRRLSSTAARVALALATVTVLFACAGGPNALREREALREQYARLRIASPEEGAVVSAGNLAVELDLDDVVADLSEIEAFELSLNGVDGDDVIVVSTFTRDGTRFLFDLSLIGAADESEFRMVVRPVLRGAVDDPLPWSGERRWRLSLMMPTPTPVFPQNGLAVLGTKVELRWSGPEGTTYRLEVASEPSFVSPTVVTTTETRWTSEQPFQANANVYWRVSSLSDVGIAGQPSETMRFRPSLDIAPAPPFPGSVPSLVDQPRIAWDPLPGAATYEVEVSAGAAARSISTDEPGVTLDTNLLSRLIGSGSVRTITWRVRARTEAGEESAWSADQFVEYRPLAPAMVPVINPGEIVRYAPPGGGESTITLTVPFAISRTELTNALVAEIATFAIRRGGARIVDGALVDTVSQTPLLGLGSLALGEQFGLRAGPGNRSVLVSDPARAGHPAVGVSWYGATAIANALSVAAGLEPAYDAGRRRRSANGYRLPTEAEWVYAATRVFPDGFSADGFAGGRVNFFRSGDSFEEVREPFTANGGPTTPVARLANGGPVGIYDLLGNAWEWCEDWHARASFPPDDGFVDPAGVSAPEVDAYGLVKRVVRGGAWNTRANDMTIDARGAFVPEAFSYSVGVRLVAPLE